MPPGELNLSGASEALKRWYLPGLQYQLNNANPVLSVMERDRDSVAGDKVYMAVRFGRQGGIANRTDSGTLPQPNSRKTKQAIFDTKNLYARIQITDKTMRASRSNRGAFVSLLEADLEDALVDSKDALSRQIYGDGTGRLATCTAQTSVNTLVLDNVQYITEGMIVDIMASNATIKSGGGYNGGIGGGSREVLMVDSVANTITVSGAAVTTLATDYLVVNGAAGLELTGFGSIFTADNTYLGIDRATNKWWNATLQPAVGSLTEVKLQKGSDDVEKNAGGNTNFYAASYGVRRAYQSLLLNTKQIVNVMKLEGGWDVLSYNGKPFTADKYCPAGTLFGLDLSSFRLYELSDFNWIDDDGSVLTRVADKPIWEATLAKYCEIATNKPRASFKMSGITEA